MEKPERKKLGSVSVEDGRVKVFINPKFYDFEDVKRVKKEFEQVSNIIIADEKSKFCVVMKPKQELKPEEMDILGYEFYNHLLNAVKERGTTEWL